MGYQLVVWEGEKPETDAAASDMCRELLDRYYVGDGFEPTPAIRKFVRALTEIWPDDPKGENWQEVPWKHSPILDDATGPLVFLNMRFGIGEEASFRIAELAEEHGLVTFDTFVEVMRPCPRELIDDWNQNVRLQMFANLTTSVQFGPDTVGDYHLIVWEGQRPETDEAGAREAEEIQQRWFNGDPTEPTPGMRAFVRALTETWTDDPTDPGWERAPWSEPNLIEDASGPALWLILPATVAVLASTVIAAIAEERGLVIFDPQVNLLRPVSEEVIVEHFQRRASALN